MPTLITLNFVDGKSQELNNRSQTEGGASTGITGLDTLAWGNIRPENSWRYTIHLAMSVVVVTWVCVILYLELKVYIKVRHDHLTSAQHRLKASATTILVCSIPPKWLTDRALRGLFDVFPGGVRNIWLNRDFSTLLPKIARRAEIHALLESAETELIQAANQAQQKRQKGGSGKESEQAGLPASTQQAMAFPNARVDRTAAELTRGKNIGIRNQGDQIKRDFQAAIRRADTGLDHAFQTGNGFRYMSHIDDPGFTQLAWRPEQAEQTSHADVGMEQKNTVRQLDGSCRFSVDSDVPWWQFWKPPEGSYTSPVPQGMTPNQTEGKKKLSETLGGWIYYVPFLDRKSESVQYPAACNPGYEEYADDAGLWQQYLPCSDRPTHRLPLLQIEWLPSLPLVGKKVDTIRWCREQLARLNVEIQQDQSQPDRFPLLNSAFVQFNSQIAAHMACQCQIHHLPESMEPRQCEISPQDVIWDNMSLAWWQEWIRATITAGLLILMTVLWAAPVASTAMLSQLDQLLQHQAWFSSVASNDALMGVLKGATGILPTVVLSLLLVLVPSILELLARFRGAKTGTQVTEFVQTFFFFFLWVQVFLVVSLASFFTLTLDQLLDDMEKFKSIRALLQLLGMSIPRAANYFFSYMILQALSVSSSTLLQAAALVQWFVIARIRDHTARNKWTTSISLREIRWGNFFPVYTNFACIALTYCIVAPLISAFAIISFSLLWMTYRYTMVYVTRFRHDSGGVLFPRAINQTFLGLYTLELCVASLFFVTGEESATRSLNMYGIGMLVVLVMTVIYQVVLNRIFSPLFRALPITLEDEAILRDEAFRRAQLSATTKRDHEAAARSKMGGQEPTETRPGDSVVPQKSSLAQAAMRDGLYGDVLDELEDLRPELRGYLINRAFQHEALRSRPPVVWIPHDELGISKDEIERTQDYSENIAISDSGTALDGKFRVQFGTKPPDFSIEDIIPF